MVLSNRVRSPAPMYKGKPFAYQGGTRAGVIFYDDEGSENGGLTFRGKLVNGKPSAAGPRMLQRGRWPAARAARAVPGAGAFGAANARTIW